MTPKKITRTQKSLNPNPYWHWPIPQLNSPDPVEIDLFDQNGYDLTVLEQKYAEVNNDPGQYHRPNHIALKYEWFTENDTGLEGAHINHALLFERKGYVGEALKQLEHWAQTNPQIYKIIKMRPKWGMDISMDYTDAQGNVFEVLHWEWDSFEYEEAESKRQQIEPFLESVDWNDAAQRILKRKDEWHHLDFFEQSAWKTKFFGIEKERFKMVLWQ
jgi:hypothetical protein